jgi:streptogramin lyase
VDSNPCRRVVVVSFSGLLIMACVLAAAALQSGTTPHYVVDSTWPRKPDHITWGQMPGVAVDTQDRIYIFNRAQPAVQVYQADGAFLRAWDIEDVGGAHGIRIGPENSVWTTDIKNHVVRKYNPEGKLLLTFGELGRAGNDERHFDRPTDVAVLPNGEVYITDGYGNRRVIHFDAEGRYINQWGEAGSKPGQFALPHSIVADSQNRLYVADRENARIQVFDRDGKLLDVWANIVTPWGLCLARDDELWVCGSSPVMGGKPGEWTVLPPPDQVVMKLNLKGQILLRMPLNRTTSAPGQPGEVNWVHGIAMDSQGSLYLGDIQGQRIQKFLLQQ